MICSKLKISDKWFQYPLLIEPNNLTKRDICSLRFPLYSIEFKGDDYNSSLAKNNRKINKVQSIIIVITTSSFSNKIFFRRRTKGSHSGIASRFNKMIAKQLIVYDRGGLILSIHKNCTLPLPCPTPFEFTLRL